MVGAVHQVPGTWWVQGAPGAAGGASDGLDGSVDEGGRGERMSTLPIGEYGLLSDCRGAALVSREGSIDWLCLPSFDSPALFARLLDDGAGHWVIRPAGPARAGRRYLGRSLVLETRWRADDGEAVVHDALAVGAGERGHELGRGSPGVVLRRVTGVRGSVTFDVELAPRPEYGLVHPVLTPVGGGLRARGGAAVLTLGTNVPLRCEGSIGRGRFTVAAGRSVVFALQHDLAGAPEPAPWTPAAIEHRLEETRRGWETWSRMHQAYEGPWSEAVHVGGRVLQALTYQPTGAIVAAPTTSLPEEVGGERNWDYRYTWVRDASMTLRALWVAACPDEAHRFFAWMAGAAAARREDGAGLPIVFGVRGEHDLSERTLPHLSGWRGSRPVRVGNDAWRQHQLDVYGELLDAACRLADAVGAFDAETRRFLAGAADAAAVRWRLPDHGIWEVRGAPRHFVHSKLMCWVALDRAIALADRLDARGRVDAWSAARDAIRAAILTRGWSDRRGAFVQTFDGHALDASTLLLAITGFLPATDPRMRRTIDAVATHLADARGLVRRYVPAEADDGLAGDEGSFLLCSFWLAHALAQAGALDRARATFEHAAAHANDLGLLSEEVDPHTGELRGNFPQAFSHIGLIDAAWAIHEAEASR